MTLENVGFIGLGRLGSALALRLIEAGYRVHCTERGNTTELVKRGALIPGDGTAADVAAAASVIFSCLPSGESLEEVANGEHGILSTHGPAPLLVELSTLPIEQKLRWHEELSERGGALLDCPVSGTRMMAEQGNAVVFASGDRARFDSIEHILQVMSPGATYVGELGSGMKLKYLANMLVFVHLAVTAETIAFAGKMGLDRAMVAELLGRSKGAMSGQFVARAPALANDLYSNDLVTVDMTGKDLKQVTHFAREVGAETPLLSIVSSLFDELVERGEGQSDPGVLARYLRHGGLDGQH